MPQTPRSYSAESSGFRFRLAPDAVAVLRTVPDFEGQEEPAVADDFLRFHAETWADALAASGAASGDYDVTLDVHQRRARLSRGGEVVFVAEI